MYTQTYTYTHRQKHTSVCVCVCVCARARAQGQRKHMAKGDSLSKTDQGVRQLNLQKRNNPR